MKPCVLLRNLPRTALPQDIWRLGGGSAEVRIDVLRTPFLQPSGSAIVTLPSERPPAWAAHRVNAKLTGGREIAASELSLDKARETMRSQYEGRPHTLYMALDALAAEPMRCVLLRNLPLQTTAEKLEKKLRRNYALVGEMGTPTPLVSDSLAPFARNDDGVRLPSELLGLSALPAPNSVLKLPPLYVASARSHRHAAGTDAWFLVRLESTAEAQRLVRSWHRRRYTPQKYPVENVGDRYVVDAELA